MNMDVQQILWLQGSLALIVIRIYSGLRLVSISQVASMLIADWGGAYRTVDVSCFRKYLICSLHMFTPQVSYSVIS